MKRKGFVFIIVGLIFFVTGCATSGMTALLAQKDTIALVSVISNEDINWQGEAPTNPDSLGPLVRRKLRNEPDMAAITKADEVVNTAEGMFREAMAASGRFNLAEKEAVLNSRSYQDAKERKYPNRDVVKPENFRLIDIKDKDFLSALAAETGIRKTMFLEFNFTKFIYTGMSLVGSARAHVEMTVIILDENRKTLYRKTISSGSGEGTKVVNGVYSQSEMLALFRDAIDAVCFELLEQFN